jgi:hypothetical protein
LEKEYVVRRVIGVYLQSKIRMASIRSGIGENMEEKANAEIKKAIDSLEFLIDEDCSDTQFDYIEEIESAIKALTELQQYHAIGTPEECRTAREKQIPKKPDFTEEKEFALCPCCNGNGLADKQEYCDNCGQKLDWSGEE